MSIQNQIIEAIENQQTHTVLIHCKNVSSKNRIDWSRLLLAAVKSENDGILNAVIDTFKTQNNTSTEDSFDALLLAAEKGYIGGIHLLISLSHPQAIHTALQKAVEHQQADSITALIPFCKSLSLIIASSKAEQLGRVDLAIPLRLASDPGIDEEHLLFQAAQMGDVETAKFLISKKTSERRIQKTLHLATEFGRFEMVEWLLTLREAQQHRSKALIIAVQEAYRDCIGLLVQTCDVDQVVREIIDDHASNFPIENLDLLSAYLSNEGLKAIPDSIVARLPHAHALLHKRTLDQTLLDPSSLKPTHRNRI